MRDVFEQTVHFTVEYIMGGKSENEPFADDPHQNKSTEERANDRYNFIAGKEGVTYVCLRDGNGQRIKTDFPEHRKAAA